MNQKKTRGQKKRKYVFCRIGGKDKTEVHLTGRMEYVRETVVVVAMVVDRERVRDRRGRARVGRVGVSGGGEKGRGGGGRVHGVRGKGRD